MSKRTDIRNAIASALSGQTSAGTNVLTSRYSALFADTFPLLLVYTPEEANELMIPAPAQYNRKLSVTISAILQADSAVDDALDALAAQIETVMTKDQTFGGLAMGSVLQKSFSEVDTVGETQLGAIHLNFEVQYFA